MEATIPQTKRLGVGQTFQITKGPVTTTQLVMYAGASGDFNRIHFDDPFARQSGLGGVIAHGMLTMGFAASGLAEAAGPDVWVTEISARFLSPVRVGDVVEVIGTVQEELPDGGAVVQLEGRVGERAVLQGRAAVIHGPGRG